LNAFKDTRAGILYKWEDKQRIWVEVLRQEVDPKAEKRCGNCDRSHDEAYTNMVWLNMKAEIPFLARLCGTCERAARKSKVKTGG
jgi:hypothetical protein